MIAEKIEALRPDFEYSDEDDRVLLSVGFTASFFFWEGHTDAKRKAVVECIEAFEAVFGEHLVWALDEDTGRWVKLSTKEYPSARQQVSRMDENDCLSIYLCSGEDNQAVSDYAVSCLTERGWMSGKISVFRFQVPRDQVFEKKSKDQVLDLIDICHRKLKPFHGSAGFSAISTYGETLWEPEKLDVATRYLTLNSVSRVDDKMAAPLGIKSISWLTFVGNTLAERLGGAEVFDAYCKRFGVTAKRFDHGLLFQADDVPGLGPIAEPVPDGYLKVNAALRPLRAGNFGSMGSGSVNGEMRFNAFTTDLWIRRFDKPGIWPPTTFIGLPETLPGSPPRKKIKLRTGEECVISGRYRHPGFGPAEPHEDDEAPHVVLLEGDYAPYSLRLGPHGEYLGREAVSWELASTL